MSGKALKVVPVDFVNLGEFVEVGPNYLRLAEDCPSDVLRGIYSKLQALAGGIAWLVGDFLCQVENLKGSDRARMLLEDWDISYGQAAEWRRVCDAFEPSQRRIELSFGHHAQALAATTSIEEAIDLLEVASARGMSISKMRQHAAEPKQLGGGRKSHGGIREVYETAKIVERLKRESLDSATRQQLKADLKPLVEWWGTL